MRLIEAILSETNLQSAIKAVKRNKGAAGIDKMSVYELDQYFNEHKSEIIEQIMQKKYKPQPVRRVYIPKANGKQRPLGIPTVVDRTIQQAVAQVLTLGYDKYFSANSYGFRPERSAQMAINQVLSYLNEGYEWIIDLDIEKYFDTVNHDKLISILREKVKGAETLHLIRSFLRAGVMEDGLVSSTEQGVPQGGPLSPVLSNIYLDKLDKELETRGLRFVRYADDCNIFVKSEKAANRVMKSIVSWIERKLFLKVNAEKSKLVRPTESQFLGFTFLRRNDTWKCKPADDRIKRLYSKVKEITCRKRATAKSIAYTFIKLNQVVRGWINYFRIGVMKSKMDKLGQWMRHRVRMIILKQWKNCRTIHRNLSILNRKFKCNFTQEDILKVSCCRWGVYKRSCHNVTNFLLSPKVLGMKTKSRPGLIDPLAYYLSSL